MLSPNYSTFPADGETIRMYVENHVDPGHFMTAILSNDLVGACNRADLQNQSRIFNIVSWLYNEIPTQCWGSPEKVKAWLEG